nr:hypothetical protein Iba_chr01dCG1570 [Ipomoea batatas]
MDVDEWEEAKSLNRGLEMGKTKETGADDRRCDMDPVANIERETLRVRCFGFLVGGSSVRRCFRFAVLQVRHHRSPPSLHCSMSPVTSAAASLSSFLRRLPTRLKIEMKAKKMVKISTSAVIKPFNFNSAVTPWNNEITDANVSNAVVPKNQVTPPLEIGAKRSCGATAWPNPQETSLDWRSPATAIGVVMKMALPN